VPEFISIPVPADRVSDVYKLLATPPAASKAAGEPEDDNVGDNDLAGPYAYARATWPNNAIHQAVQESNAVQRGFLLHLAKNQNQFFGLDVLAKTLGIAASSFRGPLSGFKRRAKARHKQERMFFDQRWTGTQNEYRLRQREAEVVRKTLA
jgi:hypothetical protein